jgi:cell division protein FtsN
MTNNIRNALIITGLIAVTPAIGHAQDEVQKATQGTESRLPAPPPSESSGTFHSSGLSPAPTTQTHVPDNVPAPRETNHGVDNSRMNPTHDPDVQRGIDNYYSSHGRN